MGLQSILASTKVRATIRNTSNYELTYNVHVHVIIFQTLVIQKFEALTSTCTCTSTRVSL